MKDATGELSMTAVAVVAIAAIGVVFTTILWPQIKTSILRSSYCSQALYCKKNTTKPNDLKDCTYCDGGNANGTCPTANLKTITCPNT